MQPLEYKYIGNEEHLTFDSIRRLVFNQLSNLCELEANQHIEDCYRCRSIHESLASPAGIRKNNSAGNIGSKVFAAILLVMVSVGLAVSFLYFGDPANLSKLVSWSLLKIQKGAITKLTPNPPQIEFTDDLKRIAAAPVLITIDSLTRVSAKPDIGIDSGVNKQFDDYIGTEAGNAETALKGIYGKISANGEPLQGVTIMAPDSRTAKVSNPSGNYYIQVPSSTTSLVYIYQGKQLIKELDSISRRHDINLKIDTMEYPEIESPPPGSENIVSN